MSFPLHNVCMSGTAFIISERFNQRGLKCLQSGNMFANVGLNVVLLMKPGGDQPTREVHILMQIIYAKRNSNQSYLYSQG